MLYKTYKHNPPHLFIPNMKYFIAGAIYQRKYLLKDDEAKESLINSILKGFLRYNWKIDDWIILNNHYHLMVESPDNVESLSRIMNSIHKFTAIWIKKNIKSSEQTDKVWWNYWDTCITYERSYNARINYLWYNPVKHELVERPEEWKFGSFHHRFSEDPETLNKMLHPFDKVKIFDEF